MKGVGRRVEGPRDVKGSLELPQPEGSLEVSGAEISGL